MKMTTSKPRGRPKKIIDILEPKVSPEALLVPVEALNAALLYAQDLLERSQIIFT